MPLFLTRSACRRREPEDDEVSGDGVEVAAVDVGDELEESVLRPRHAQGMPQSSTQSSSVVRRRFPGCGSQCSVPVSRAW